MLGMGKCPFRVEFEEPAVPTLRGPVNRWVTSLEQLLNVGVIPRSFGYDWVRWVWYFAGDY